jgi:glycosyltransferase domain-containing protein
MNPRLTIVVPLKGRPLFTLRFLWHANKARLPYRFVIADGEVRPELADLLENSSEIFPEIDIEYIRYPNDVDFRHYFAKMADALQRVRTPYAMLADNDDFLALTGIERSIDFLDASPDYVCCGGGIAGFSVYSRRNPSLMGLIGPLNRLAYRYMPFDRSTDLNSSSVTDRLLQGLRNSWSYYAVIRSDALMTIWREVLEMQLSDLQLHEKFCAMRTLTLGKARSDPATVAYLRQYWTTLRSAFQKDWVHHLLRNRFSIDFANIIARVSQSAATSDGLDKDVIAESLQEGITPWLRDFLRLNYGPSGILRQHLRSKVPNLLTWLKTRRRLSVLFERRDVLQKLRKRGASDEYLKAFAAELAQIENVISGEEFSDFIRPHIAKFGAGESGLSIVPSDHRLVSLSRGQNA